MESLLSKQQQTIHEHLFSLQMQQPLNILLTLKSTVLMSLSIKWSLFSVRIVAVIAGLSQGSYSAVMAAEWPLLVWCPAQSAPGCGQCTHCSQSDSVGCPAVSDCSQQSQTIVIRPGPVGSICVTIKFSSLAASQPFELPVCALVLCWP